MEIDSARMLLNKPVMLLYATKTYRFGIFCAGIWCLHVCLRNIWPLELQTEKKTQTKKKNGHTELRCSVFLTASFFTTHFVVLFFIFSFWFITIRKIPIEDKKKKLKKRKKFYGHPVLFGHFGANKFKISCSMEQS